LPAQKFLMTCEDRLVLKQALAYPMIPEMHQSALRIKKTNQILRCGDAR